MLLICCILFLSLLASQVDFILPGGTLGLCNIHKGQRLVLTSLRRGSVTESGHVLVSAKGHAFLMVLLQRGM